MRDQRPYGTCWAFSAVASLESRLLPSQSYDFSEDNVALRSGYDTESGAYDQGGNFSMSTAYLTRWDGPVLEAEDPYGDNQSPTGLSAAVHVQDVFWVPGGATATDNENIKYALMEYGAVQTAIHWEAAAMAESSSSYYYSGADWVNHAVVIVGWDDGYPASRFRETPAGDGAWLVRNSWGSQWAEAGYFWMSYYDRYAGTNRQRHVVFGDVAELSEYTDLYSYDDLGEVGTYGYAQAKVWGANVFRAHADESIVALGFYAPVPSTQYTLYAGGTLGELRALGSGTLAMAGYNTVRLATALTVTRGSDFAVAVRLVAPGCEYPLSVEYAIPGYSSQASASFGQSFTRVDDGVWEDLTDWNASANVCLKAYAGVPSAAAEDLTPPHTAATGADDRWHRAPVTVTFTAADAGVDASGVASTEYRLDGGEWIRSASAVVRTDGVHALEYRSTDVAGNVEASQSCTVKVDSVGPSCGVRSAAVRRGALAAVRVMGTDGLSPKVSTWLTVRSAAGVVKLKVADATWSPAGVWRTVSFRCTLPRGTYQLVTRGVDLAGNRESMAGRASLQVD